jgi:hypothetical protein
VQLYMYADNSKFSQQPGRFVRFFASQPLQGQCCDNSHIGKACGGYGANTCPPISPYSTGATAQRQRI